MLAIVDGELMAGPGGPPGPAIAPAVTVAWVLWDDGRAVCWPSDADDPRIAAWQDAARRLVSPEHPLELLVV